MLREQKLSELKKKTVCKRSPRCAATMICFSCTLMTFQAVSNSGRIGQGAAAAA
jgi:hypothetical protein